MWGDKFLSDVNVDLEKLQIAKLQIELKELEQIQEQINEKMKEQNRFKLLLTNAQAAYVQTQQIGLRLEKSVDKTAHHLSLYRDLTRSEHELFDYLMQLTQQMPLRDWMGHPIPLSKTPQYDEHVARQQTLIKNDKNPPKKKPIHFARSDTHASRKHKT